MENKEFNLSEKMYRRMFPIEDVKEFIKILKEQLTNFYGDNNGWCENIDKLAGDKLNGN